MANSYVISSSSRDWRPAMVDLPFNNIAGHPYLANQTAALTIFNRPDSNRIVRIKRVAVRDAGMTTTSVELSQFRIERISAYTGGEAGDYVKLDSASANIPSQIAILEDLESVTVSGSSIFRVGLNMPQYNITRVLNPLNAAVLGERRKGMSNANTYLNHNNADVQNLVLREGEGMAISPVSNAVRYTMKYLINVFFKIGSEHYMTSSNITTEPRPTYVVFNNTGSGVVVEILSVEVAENGTDEFPHILTVEHIDYLDTNTAAPVGSLASMDSTNESLTGLVDVTSFARVHLAGYNAGATIQRSLLKKFAGTNSISAPNVAGGILNFAARRIKEDKHELSDIVLNPGRGIGLFKRNGSGNGKLGVAITFTVEEIAAPSGGAYGFGFA